MTPANSAHAQNLRRLLSTYLCDQEWDVWGLRAAFQKRPDMKAAFDAQIEHAILSPDEVTRLTGLGKTDDQRLAAFFSAVSRFIFGDGPEPDPDRFFD